MYVLYDTQHILLTSRKYYRGTAILFSDIEIGYAKTFNNLYFYNTIHRPRTHILICAVTSSLNHNIYKHVYYEYCNNEQLYVLCNIV